VKDLPEAHKFAQRVAEGLKSHRLEIGMSKLAVAQKAGLDQRTITFIEEGVNVPSLVTLYAICESLGLEVADIVTTASKTTLGKRGKNQSKRKSG